MAGRLMPAITRDLSTALCLLAGLAQAQAQLSDPTKPPLSVSTPATEQGSPVAANMSGLQSVILRKQGKPAALINGELVELGGKVGEMTLIRIDEDAALLRGPEGKETLRLTPAAEKKVGTGATAKTAHKGTGK